jgi:molybdate transport system ATP-binding protein
VTSLRARIVVRRAGFELDAAIEARAGEVLGLLGPNGAGKSTLVHALAGLIPLDCGEVCVGDVVWEDCARQLRRAPQQRSVGVVFQGWLLFPALSALDNVAYGLRARGRRRDEAKRRALELMEIFDIAHLAAKLPNTLSGGEAQRVALARALAVEPDLLLLDEPMSALDVQVRAEARRALRLALDSFGGVKLLVTHEPLEAMALSDRIVILESGRIVQAGTPPEIRARPRSRYAASLVGLNMLAGTIVTRAGHPYLDTGAGGLAVADTGGLCSGADALATVHPRAITLSTQPDRPRGSPRNVLEARVATIDLLGDRARVLLDSHPPLIAEITAEALEDLDLAAARRVWATVKATQIDVYPA